MNCSSRIGPSRWSSRRVRPGRGSSIDYQERGIHFVLAHAKRLRVIAESNYKSDDIDAELLARMRLAGLIPEVHPKAVEQREQAVLLRNRARLVRAW